MRTVIVGCGHAGWSLTRRLAAKSNDVCQVYVPWENIYRRPGLETLRSTRLSAGAVTHFFEAKR